MDEKHLAWAESDVSASAVHVFDRFTMAFILQFHPYLKGILSPFIH